MFFWFTTGDLEKKNRQNQEDSQGGRGGDGGIEENGHRHGQQCGDCREEVGKRGLSGNEKIQ